MATLHIGLAKFAHNVHVVNGLVRERGADLVAVTKVFSGDAVLARILLDNGVDMLADARLSNLEKLKALPGRRMLLRAPTQAEGAQAVALADVTLISHNETAKALSDAAMASGRRHDLIMMIDEGDLREGVICEGEAVSMAVKIAAMPGVRLAGVGVNFCCMKHVAPTREKLEHAQSIRKSIEARTGAALPVFSGGNSSAFKLLLTGRLPGFVNQLRIGEAIALGVETIHGDSVPGAYQDCFTLTVEIIELREKMESGQPRLRALCAIGRQDIHPADIFPMDSRVRILGASSDHLALSLDACRGGYALGDKVAFKMNYAGLLALMSSADVERRYI